MGNSSSKDHHQQSPRGPVLENTTNGTVDRNHGQTLQPRTEGEAPAARVNVASRSSHRGNSSDVPFMSLGRDRDHSNQLERARETRQEREARKLEKERQARLKERERSIREEHVDGGYLVTLGTYTGPEDFSKPVVRQLQIERRLAPFWRGLNDHSTSWTEAQLVAAARGLPIPAPDEPPPQLMRNSSQVSFNPSPSNTNVDGLTVAIGSRSRSYESSATLSPSPLAFPNNASLSPSSPSTSTAQLLRGRAKTLASLATGSKSHSPDMTPKEMQLPKDPYFNGQPLEAFLYKDASECPICFLYYPPWLNRTRCCDQPICSECFVQIKRPDPHPPEHEQPGQQRPPEEAASLLVSEVASCPFCVTPEFGVTYNAPPFRRGLAHANANTLNPLKNPSSAMSSTSSLIGGIRKRATSLSANAPQVVTTDRVRPDWAKKLADARANVLRRSAAATALHNAAYALGNQGDPASFHHFVGLGRRRRTIFDDFGTSTSISAGEGPSVGVPPFGLMRMAGDRRDESEDGVPGDLFPTRGSSRRARVEDLEDLMMMEAIRLSLAAEEERKKKDEKGAKKEAKKRAKEEKKEAKQAEKASRKGTGASSSQPPQPARRESEVTAAGTEVSLGMTDHDVSPGVDRQGPVGKGKAPMLEISAASPVSEPPSGLRSEFNASLNDDAENGNSPQQHASIDAAKRLEGLRTNLPSTSPSSSSHLVVQSPANQSSTSRETSSTSSLDESQQSNTPPIPAGSSNSVSPNSSQAHAANEPGSAGVESGPLFPSQTPVPGGEEDSTETSKRSGHLANERERLDSSTLDVHSQVDSVSHGPGKENQEAGNERLWGPATAKSPVDTQTSSADIFGPRPDDEVT